MGGLAGKNHWDEIEDRRDEGLKVKAEEIHSTLVEETSGEWEGEKSHGEILELKETPKVWRPKKKKKNNNGVFKNIQVFLMYIFLAMDLIISSRKMRVNTKEEETDFQTKLKDPEKGFSGWTV